LNVKKSIDSHLKQKEKYSISKSESDSIIKLKDNSNNISNNKQQSSKDEEFTKLPPLSVDVPKVSAPTLRPPTSDSHLHEFSSSTFSSSIGKLPSISSLVGDINENEVNMINTLRRKMKEDCNMQHEYIGGFYFVDGNYSLFTFFFLSEYQIFIIFFTFFLLRF